MSTSKGSQLARGASMAADVWQKLDARVKARGGTDEDMYRLANKEGEGILDMVADRLVKMGAVQRNRYPAKASHKSLQEAIAAGKYDYASDYITAEHFKLEGEIVVAAELVIYPPDRDIESDDVVKELDQMGLRPATLQELCAFGEKYPDIQREFPIVALGSVYVDAYGGRFVPFLDCWSAGRRLSLGDWGGEWIPFYRFLAARK
jgi:hypothetical protein